MSSASGELNTNSEGSNGVDITIGAGEHIITLYIFGKTGTHNQHEVCLEYSPNGTDWMNDGHVIIGEGEYTVNKGATHARAIVKKAEGAASTCTAYLMSTT